jgi:hypothetical protein
MVTMVLALVLVLGLVLVVLVLRRTWLRLAVTFLLLGY